MRFFRRKKMEEVKEKVMPKDIAMKALLFVVGTMLSALAFNLFYVPQGFVGGGLGGVAIILNKIFELDASFVVLIGNTLLIILSLFTLGFKESLMSIVGASVYTVFVYLTEDVPQLINFSFDNILLYVIAAGVVGGIGESIIYKTGFNSGGTSILAFVIQKYKKIPLGKLLRNIGMVIIVAGGFVFGYTAVMYSLLITFISTYLVDKILIGISDSKTFFIQTSKEAEVTEFVLKIIESGVTEFDTKGAYTNKKKKMLMCVVPTEKYSLLKSAIKEIDPEAFIVVSDCYEVLGGTKRKKVMFDE
ncbi:MAG: YitT family protein [Bacilli bacterium]|jgi:uncharacterized membrane-anchored protein YitT (DUF2179 family)|nr:YitT family protein [Bacilli bacterium]